MSWTDLDLGFVCTEALKLILVGMSVRRSHVLLQVWFPTITCSLSGMQQLSSV